MVDVFGRPIDKGLRDDFMKGLPIRDGEVQFADDTLCFSNYNLPLFNNLKNIVTGYEVMSGLRVYLSKTLLVGLNICNSKASTDA